jgi:hypothetical protein
MDGRPGSAVRSPSGIGGRRRTSNSAKVEIKKGTAEAEHRPPSGELIATYWGRELLKTLGARSRW